VLIAAISGFLAQRLNRSVVVGYALAGILLSFLVSKSPIVDLNQLEGIAQTALAISLFCAGVQINFTVLRDLWWMAVAGAVSGLFATTALTLLIGQWLQWSEPLAFLLGAALSLSSTTLILQLTTGQDGERSLLFRLLIAVTWVQEFVVLAAMFALPVLRETSLTISSERTTLLIGKGILTVALVILLRLKWMSFIASRFGWSHHSELCMVGGIAMAAVTAVATEAGGFLFAFTAFVAGSLPVVVNLSEVRWRPFQ
jgi:CPA2 family monovalent cation:H+ antiporter-2